MPKSKNNEARKFSNGVKAILAKKTGFCFGVKRAVNMAERALKENRPIYSLGSIIHNRQVVDRLSKRGLEVVKDIDDINRGTLVVSSHGISPTIARDIKAKGMSMIDTTCPFVMTAQKIAKRLNDEGYSVIIVGDADHPEIKALIDFAPKNAIVVKNSKEARQLTVEHADKVSMISQTTQATDNFLEVVKVLLEKRPAELRVFNTICKDAEVRQAQAKRLAGEVDMMLVVGGRDSANTRRLFDVCKSVSKDTYLVEKDSDVDETWFKCCRRVGITSGASTPDWVVSKVVDRIKKKGAA